MQQTPNADAPVRRGSEDARQFAYRIIKSEILELGLLPGQKMNEVDIATSLDLSRTPVHDTFFKLSRENLAQIIPQRGAFVSRISAVRVENALWLHEKLGCSMIQSLYINRISEAQLQVFRHIQRMQKAALQRGDETKLVQLLCDFYQQLYLFAGRFDCLWQALQKTDLDFRRLLYLSGECSDIASRYADDLQKLIDAIAARSSDRACEIFRNHLGDVRRQMVLLKSRHPEYFCEADTRSAS